MPGFGPVLCLQTPMPPGSAQRSSIATGRPARSCALKRAVPQPTPNLAGVLQLLACCKLVLQVILKEYDFAPKPGFDPGMTTGATIHTKNGLYMNVSKRQKSGASAQPAAAAVGAA